MPTRPSRTAVAIAEQLGADGLDIPASTVQFWAERGLLGPCGQTWSGGGGSDVAYPEDALEVARLIHFLPKRSRKRSDVVLACFCRGLAVSVHELRAALVAETEEAWAEGGDALAAAESEEEVAEAAAQVAATVVARRRRPAVLRSWERNSRGWEPAGSGTTPEADAMDNDERLTFMLSAVLAALGGDPGGLEPAIGGLVLAAGAGPVLDQALVAKGRLRVDLEAKIATAATAMLERLRDAAATVEVEEMADARRVILAMTRAGSDPEPVPALEGPLRPLGSDCRITAMWALVLVIVVRNGPVSMDELARMFGQE